MVILLFVVLLILYIKLLIWQAMRIAPPNLSDFELKRRAALGDAQASELVRQGKELPKLLALRRVVKMLLWVGIAGISAVAGLVPWAIWSLLLLLSPLIARHKQLRAWATIILRRYHMYIVNAAQFSWPLTRWWASRRPVTAVPVQSVEELLDIIDHTHQVSAKQKDAIHARLSFQQKRVKDFMIPITKVVTVAHDELLGPMMLDELHRTKQQVFPVKSGDAIVGLLHAEKVMSIKQADSLQAAEAMDRAIYYVAPEAPADTIWQLSLQTKETMYLVADKNGEIIGVVMLDVILRAMLGYKKELKLSDFEDPRSVAASAATERE